MGAPDSDWKHQARQVPNWVVAGLALLLVAVEGYLWAVDSIAQAPLLAVIILGWLGIYFTSYWHPILYLVIGLIITAVILFWLIQGLWERPVGLLAMLLKGAFVFLVTYLFYCEEESLGPIPETDRR